MMQKGERAASGNRYPWKGFWKMSSSQELQRLWYQGNIFIYLQTTLQMSELL